MKKTKIISNLIVITIGLVGICVTLYISQNLKETPQSVKQEEINEETEIDEKITTNDEKENKQDLDNNLLETEDSSSSNQKSKVQYDSQTNYINQKEVPKSPIISEETGNIDKPIIPETPVQPEQPSEEIKDLLISNNMAEDGVITIANKKYRKVIINSDIE